MTERLQRRPFYELLGLDVDGRQDRALVRMDHRPELGNSRGDVHGGAITSLLDAVLSRAVRLQQPALAGVTTVNLTVHFLGPGRGGLLAEGHVVSCGRTIAVAEANVRDQGGNLVAGATATFRLFWSRTKASSGSEEETDAAEVE